MYRIVSLLHPTKPKTKNYPAPNISSFMVAKLYLRPTEPLMDLGIGAASSEAYGCVWECWMSQQN